MKNKSVLLIGGAGYVGSVITDSLLASGCQVTCLDLLLYQNNYCVVPYLLNPNYKFIYGDMCNPLALDLALDGITDVILLAGLVSDFTTKKYPAESNAINNVGTLKCIDHLNNCNLDHVIFISSCSNYGLLEKDQMANEEFALSPTSTYAQDKITVEQYLLSLKGKVDYTPTILRFATAFGLSPRLRLDLTINEFAYAAEKGEEIVVFNPHAWRPYCHVKDFARLIKLVLDAPHYKVAFEVFNAGGDINNYTKQSIVDAIVKEVPTANVRYQEQITDPRNYRIDFTKVKTVLGFEPRFTVTEGIQEIIDAMRKHLYDNADPKSNLYGNYNIKYDQQS